MNLDAHTLNALLEPLSAAMATMSPTDWLQLGSVAVLSWLGGRAITQGDQDDDEPEPRMTVAEATKYRRIR